MIICIHRTCNLGLNHNTPQQCAALFNTKSLTIIIIMSNNSPVYSCLLDASKAFDKVHYGTLFHILLNRKVPFCIIRLLMDSFEIQRARVMWNSHVSDYFSISNGVKQGGVISPVMFNLYLDNLLISLKSLVYVVT